jgi:DNA-binding MarR family transcriptional regulator
MSPSPNDCAREVLDVVPLVMRTMRMEIRHNRRNDLSVPQFRTLIFLNRNPGAQLSNLAEHLGLTPPSASKLIDGLVAKQLVERQLSLVDRRRVTLTLTQTGKILLDAAYQETQAYFTDLFAVLSDRDLSNLIESMQILRRVFVGNKGSKVNRGIYAGIGN